MAYNVKMAALMMRAAGKKSAFVFESWGWQYHPAWTVTKTFADNGLAVGHVDPMIAVFVAADSDRVGLPLPISVPPSQPKKTWFGQTATVASSQDTTEASFTLPERLPDTHPLSAQIASARADTAAQGKFGADDFETMLRRSLAKKITRPKTNDSSTLSAGRRTLWRLGGFERLGRGKLSHQSLWPQTRVNANILLSSGHSSCYTTLWNGAYDPADECGSGKGCRGGSTNCLDMMPGCSRCAGSLHLPFSWAMPCSSVRQRHIPLPLVPCSSRIPPSFSFTC